MEELITLTEEEKNFLRASGLLVQYPKMHVIFSSGEPADRIYMVESGQVKIYRLEKDGSRATVALRYPGELIGLAEAFYGGKRTCFAQSITGISMAMLQRQDFLNLLLKHPELNLKISRILSLRLREAQNTIYEMACRYVPGRLAMLLLKLAGRCGILVPDGIVLDMPLTHEEIACLIGSSRPNTTAVLNSFRQEKSITWQGKHLKILSPEKLSRWL